MTEGQEGALGTRSTRRGLLTWGSKLAAGITAAATVGFGKPEESQAIESEITSPDWGKIANTGHEGDLTRGIFFFAGEPNPNSRYPHLDTVTDWDSDENIEKIFDDIKKANVNVINLSWWGDHGETEKWAPTINSKEVNERVFKEANARGMLVAPVIEVSPEFEFYKDFPDNTRGFEVRIDSLLSTYGNNANWLQVSDKKGEKRHFIRLVESIHGSQIDPQKFARKFDEVSEKIYSKTGKKLIFGIDPTPLPADGSYFGPDEKELSKSNSVIITPYNIFSDGESEDERIVKADQILKRWTKSGIPIIMPLITGFDDTGTDRLHTQKFGNSVEWRGRIRGLFEKYSSSIRGVNFDSWNTDTEGGSDAPTKEYGDVNYKFVQNIFNEPVLNPFVKKEFKFKATLPQVTSNS